jgi:uncharacterized protein (DUF58 family)
MRRDAVKEQIRKLRLTARRLIHTAGEGSFRTIFHGRGIEFAAIREYVPGDDIRQIEWNTTARRGTPYVKTFVEERDLSIILVLDLSSSMDVKKESFLQLVALITTLADYHDDRIGCLGFSEKVEFFLPPIKNPAQPDRILHLLLTQRQHTRKTSIRNALGFLRRVLKKHSILFLISDFLDRDFEQNLVPLSKKHEIVGVYLFDPAEKIVPSDRVIDCYDPESGKRILLDTYDRTTREDYRSFFETQKRAVLKSFAQGRGDLLMAPAGPGVELHLIDFLRRREASRGPVVVTS